MNESPPPVTDKDPVAEPESMAGFGRVRLQAPSLVMRLLGVLQREPVLFISLSYLFVSALGLWSSYWFYRQFDLPILEYMQSSDFFVAGLRRPEFVLTLLYVLVMVWLSTWPLRWNERNPERAQQLRERRWWGKWLLPHRKSWQYLWGARSETFVLVGFLLMAGLLLSDLNSDRAAQVYQGVQGDKVRVTLADSRVLPGDSRLLGTSSAFVFLWWPSDRKNEVIPIESVLRIEFIGLQGHERPAAAAASK